MVFYDREQHKFGAISRANAAFQNLESLCETMVRTRAENIGRRAVAAKAPRKQLGGGSSSSSVLSSPGSKDKTSGGNPVRWTPTPSWQKGIGNFFSKCNSSNDENSGGSNEDTTPSTNSSSLHLQPSSEITSLDE